MSPAAAAGRGETNLGCGGQAVEGVRYGPTILWTINDNQTVYQTTGAKRGHGPLNHPLNIETKSYKKRRWRRRRAASATHHRVGGESLGGAALAAAG